MTKTYTTHVILKENNCFVEKAFSKKKPATKLDANRQSMIKKLN